MITRCFIHFALSPGNVFPCVASYCVRKISSCVYCCCSDCKLTASSLRCNCVKLVRWVSSRCQVFALISRLGCCSVPRHTVTHGMKQKGKMGGWVGGSVMLMKWVYHNKKPVLWWTNGAHMVPKLVCRRNRHWFITMIHKTEPVHRELQDVYLRELTRMCLWYIILLTSPPFLSPCFHPSIFLCDSQWLVWAVSDHWCSLPYNER